MQRNFFEQARLFRYALVAALCAAVSLTAGFAEAAPCKATVATLVSLQGSVDAKPVGAKQWQSVAMNDEFCPGDSIRTNAESRADLLLGDQSVLRVREQTTLVVEGPKDERSYALDLLQGAAHFFSRQGARNLEVETPYAVAGVRGTEFGVEVADGNTTVRVFEGSVLASNAAGSVILADGQTAVAEQGKAPLVRVELQPRDAVRWTLYYPPVLEGDGASAPARRASELLAVGKIDAALDEIDASLASTPNDGDALALSSIIALAQNDKATAARVADEAVRENPSSVSALLAQSYARQASFDLDGARDSLASAVAIAPENALVWARLAEIRSSLGDTRGSAAAAKRAEQIDPNLALTQTVLGFAQLASVNIDAASAAFAKAVELGPADPLPRLGLGLAKIRTGQLREGGRQIEIAASLDPNNAMVRSYLGKVYFEERRASLDEREYAQAKELDPQDPTPWFYDAIAKQTTNRPVEALRNYEKAIELNGNRAVYRSRLLLDSDLASRSAALGRIYGDLGFQNLALVEGWKSVNTDPSNHSAHRLLADSYAALPRHEIARVSELLQSQLLQPINSTPIQPRLGEANLALVGTQGPSQQSFNEFNPMFSRDGLTLQTSAFLGGDETYAGEAVVSGIQNRASFSIGASGYTADGFRTNNDRDDEVYTFFTQYEFSPQTSLQAEVRYRDIKNGDLELRFLEDDFSPFLDETADTTTGRLGFRHSFSPNWTMLASYIHADADSELSEFVPDPFFGDFAFDIDTDETGDMGEVQHLFRWRSDNPDRSWFSGLDVVAGGGHSEVDVDETITTTFDPFPPDVVDLAPDVTHSNVYLYSNIAMPLDLTLSLGVSGDFFEEDDGVGETDQANPKVGITWNPSFSPGTTVRGAAFRVLTRTLLTQQTLEPTQVAGFNQFYDDPPGTDSWRYGVAVDQKFTESLFGGIEASRRELEVPISFVGAGSAIVEEHDWDEYGARTYLFFTPHEWVSLRAEYEYEKVERDEDSFAAFEEVETHRIPLGINVFHPSGYSWSFAATYIDQEGTFLRNSDFAFEDGDRDLWFLDTGVRLRLPKRYGFISVGVSNLLDEDSPYQATDVRNPVYRPGRLFFSSVTLSLSNH